MKKKMKKAFTLVELLVVIAILAILSTVAIVGYNSFTEKANVSNDTVITKELNTILKASDAVEEVETFEDVVEVLHDNGFLLKNLNAKTDGFFFVWDSKTNQMLLVDADENFKVVYPEDGYTPAGDSWYLTYSDVDALEGYTVPTGVILKTAAGSIDDFEEFIAQGGEQTIYVDESIVLQSDKRIVLDDVNSDITLVFSGSSLSSNGNIDQVPIQVNNGKLTIVGGNINASGETTNIFGTFNYAIGINNDSEVNLENVTISNIHASAVGGANVKDGDIHINIKDSTFENVRLGVNLSCGGKGGLAVIENTYIDAYYYGIHVTQGSKVIINSGTFKCSGTAVVNTLHATNPGHVEINGGTFYGKLNLTEGTCFINGGTFYDTGLDLVEFEKYVASGKTVVANADGSWTVK